MGVSFHGGILSKSRSASLMVITLPDVALLTVTPPRRAFPGLKGPPCLNIAVRVKGRSLLANKAPRGHLDSGG